jgi:hypothetical protein
VKRRSSSGRISVAGNRRHQARLGRRQQLREHSEVTAAGGPDPQRRVHVDPDHMPARRKPQLPLASKQHVPWVVFCWLVRARGTGRAVGLAPGLPLAQSGPTTPAALRALLEHPLRRLALQERLDEGMQQIGLVDERGV